VTSHLPEPPLLGGITWRSARVDDAGAIIALQDACFEVDGGFREVESEILDRWKTDQCNVERDSLVAVRADRSIVAVVWAYVPSIAATKWRGFHDNYVHPDYRLTELQEFVLHWWEARCRQRLESKDDGLPRYLWIVVYDWQLDRVEFLESRGYSARRYFDELARDLNDPIESRSLPDGIGARTFSDAPLSDSLRVHNEAFTDHWGSQPVPEVRWAQNENEFHLPAASFVAYDGGEPVGYVMSAVFRHDFEDKGRSEAWVEGLGTIRSHRKRGIGSALVSMAMDVYKYLGMEYAVLGVDSANPTGAHHLYESLGFVQDRRSIAFVKEITE
jgi:mycothiol synthase